MFDEAQDASKHFLSTRRQHLLQQYDSRLQADSVAAFSSFPLPPLLLLPSPSSLPFSWGRRWGNKAKKKKGRVFDYTTRPGDGKRTTRRASRSPGLVPIKRIPGECGEISRRCRTMNDGAKTDKGTCMDSRIRDLILASTWSIRRALKNVPGGRSSRVTSKIGGQKHLSVPKPTVSAEEEGGGGGKGSKMTRRGSPRDCGRDGRDDSKKPMAAMGKRKGGASLWLTMLHRRT